MLNKNIKTLKGLTKSEILRVGLRSTKEDLIFDVKSDRILVTGFDDSGERRCMGSISCSLFVSDPKVANHLIEKIRFQS